MKHVSLSIVSVVVPIIAIVVNTLPTSAKMSVSAFCSQNAGTCSRKNEGQPDLQAQCVGEKKHNCISKHGCFHGYVNDWDINSPETPQQLGFCDSR